MVPCKTLFISTNLVFRINSSRLAGFFNNYATNGVMQLTQAVGASSVLMIPGENSTSTFSKNTLRKGKKHNFTVVFMAPKPFTKLSVLNKAELILYGRLKKEIFLGIQQKDITKLAEVDFWPTNTSQASMFLKPSKLNFRLKQFGFKPVM